jgi:hypothetical protein
MRSRHSGHEPSFVQDIPFPPTDRQISQTEVSLPRTNVSERNEKDQHCAHRHASDAGIKKSRVNLRSRAAEDYLTKNPRHHGTKTSDR